MSGEYVNRVTVEELKNVIYVDSSDAANVVKVDELKNIIKIDELDPNKVTVSINGSPARVTSTTWLYGSGEPDNESGSIGDYYINIDTGDYYGPKLSTGWPDEPFFTAMIPSEFTINRYVYTQESPSDTWVITHVLGGRPSITVVDSAGTVVIGEVTYNSDTQITVSFTVPFSGYAYLT